MMVTYNRNNLIEKNKRVEITNTAVKYLLSQESFKNEIIESVEVTYDKKAQIYLAAFKFENNPRKANVIISDSNEINDISQ